MILPEAQNLSQMFPKLVKRMQLFKHFYFVMANIFKPMKSQTPPPYTKVLSDSVRTGPEPSHIYGNMP